MGGAGIIWDTLEAMQVFAKGFIQTHGDGAVIGLSGDLGAGKTSFVRACIETVAINAQKPVPRVVSPSFVLHQQYSLGREIDHFDLYRLESIDEAELIEIGYPEALERAESGGLLFVEWPEKVLDVSLLRLTERLSIDVRADARHIKVEIF